MASENEPVHTETFSAPDLVCKAVTVYADRAEIKRVVKAALKVCHQRTDLETRFGIV